MTDTTRIDAVLAGLPADQRVEKLVRARMAESDERWGSPS